jgi:hypothetical protein
MDNLAFSRVHTQAGAQLVTRTSDTALRSILAPPRRRPVEAFPLIRRMANQLLRRIEPGEEVVVLSRYTGGTLTAAARTFKCSHGAGMHPLQEGTGIWGSWVATGRQDRIDSYMIDAASTGGPSTRAGSSSAPSQDAQVMATLRQLRGG